MTRRGAGPCRGTSCWSRGDEQDVAVGAPRLRAASGLVARITVGAPGRGTRRSRPAQIFPLSPKGGSWDEQPSASTVPPRPRSTQREVRASAAGGIRTPIPWVGTTASRNASNRTPTSNRKRDVDGAAWRQCV